MLKIEKVAHSDGLKFRRISLTLGLTTISLNPWTLSIGRHQTARTRHWLVTFSWAAARRPGLQAALTLCAWETAANGYPLCYYARILSARALRGGRHLVRHALDNSGLPDAPAA